MRTLAGEIYLRLKINLILLSMRKLTRFFLLPLLIVVPMWAEAESPNIIVILCDDLGFGGLIGNSIVPI